jgi:hypothetical protein
MHDSPQNYGALPPVTFRPGRIDVRFIAGLEAKGGGMSERDLNKEGTPRCPEFPVRSSGEDRVCAFL